LTQSSASLVANQNLLTKVYFPRLFIPLASVLSGLVDFGAAFVVLLALMGYYRVVPGPALVLVPLFVLFAVATGLAVGLWLSALTIQYRDVRYALPFLTQFWLWATPVAYPASLIPAPWPILCGFNPMAGVVEGFRWALLGGAHPPTDLALVSALGALGRARLLPAHGSDPRPLPGDARSRAVDPTLPAGAPPERRRGAPAGVEP